LLAIYRLYNRGHPLRVRGQNLDVDPLRGNFLIIWIPACAGMTSFLPNGLSGLWVLMAALNELGIARAVV
jgi:hypothetical protein